jgi:hypothetical protein
MAYNPDLSDGCTPEEYALALALGYTFIERAHAGHHVPLTEDVLPQHPFTIEGQYVRVQQLCLDSKGYERLDRRGRRLIRARLLPLPTSP